MLTAYVEPPQNLSRAMTRVSEALKKFAPQRVEFVPQHEAELVVLHVIGHHNLNETIMALRSRGQRYAVIQYCFKTTARRRAADWIDTWRGAELVWSYYDLAAELKLEDYRADVNFLLAPLGVDATFRWQEIEKNHPLQWRSGETHYGIVTSGTMCGEQEAIDFCYHAARMTGRKVFHVGLHAPIGMPETDRRIWTSKQGISDQDLCAVYCLSDYVSGLRWTEGFELPVVEGLMCKARPICFDIPVYRRWFDGLASFVPHDPARLLDSLIRLLMKPEPVTTEQVLECATRFDWTKIIPSFWERIR